MPYEPVNIFEYEDIAKRKLDKAEYDFIAGGTTDEITLRQTRSLFNSIKLRPSMLVDVSHRDTSTTVLGQPISFPVTLDPTGNHESVQPGR